MRYVTCAVAGITDDASCLCKKMLANFMKKKIWHNFYYVGEDRLIFVDICNEILSVITSQVTPVPVGKWSILIDLIFILMRSYILLKLLKYRKALL